MDNKKGNQYYLEKLLKDLAFLYKHTVNLSQEEFEENEILIDSVMFRLIQISENSGKLTDEFKEQFSNIPWRAMKGMRNRIVHEYGNVDLTVIYETVKNDIPELLHELEQIKEGKAETRQ